MSNTSRVKILPHLRRKMSRFPTEAGVQAPAESGRRRIRLLLAAATLLVTLFAGYPLMVREGRHGPTGTTTTVTPCDTLAAHPADTQKLAAGVSQDRMDVRAARAACAQALVEHPQDGRILYQLSRTYIAGQEYDSGLGYLRKSADAGYAQGQFSLAMLLIQGQGHLPSPCEGAQLLIKAARQRHFYSKIYLGRYWLNGAFKNCGLPVTDAEITQLISAASELTSTPEEKNALAELEAGWERR